MQFSATFIATILALSTGVLSLPQAITGKATDFGTYFCKTRSDVGKDNGKLVASNNFCQAAGGAVLASAGVSLQTLF
ncbi:hypothetical protein CkaCkLH20_10799 [Colletotrichum karsti]|uniref:Uncharacterized protein n=1 Tax=Colletotrichum karsti TaxID=1095194 RepID=A0A9P6HXD3_9PEZI|nr:uncharacterized protein CkaCkLH20_10799 [Colletotrichum karsti]KAF9871865.1 hypothetical protein CkaCkLH20_10799 [Colletotrichum karsti]